VTEGEELAARRIAARGREAVVERLRAAFAHTLASRGDQVAIAPDQLEELVQAAADRADGVVWRRALAGVAVDELGLSLAEAVDHPAVQRAQEMLRAPAYEAPHRPRQAHRAPTSTAFAPVRVAALHLGGIETLPVRSSLLELRFSEAGLDVVDPRDGEAIGRLPWEDIAGLELSPPRRSLRRPRPGGAELVVRTERGLARFELPDVGEEQARHDLAPVLARASPSPLRQVRAPAPGRRGPGPRA
jgi:hypothetical protein